MIVTWHYDYELYRSIDSPVISQEEKGGESSTDDGLLSDTKIIHKNQQLFSILFLSQNLQILQNLCSSWAYVFRYLMMLTIFRKEKLKQNYGMFYNP